MNEDNIKDKFNDICKDKLELLPDPKFTFVRAIGNKIIDVKNGPFYKQGPVYIRSTMNAFGGDIDMWEAWVVLR
jgi:hypothetical protein